MTSFRKFHKNPKYERPKRSLDRQSIHASSFNKAAANTADTGGVLCKPRHLDEPRRFSGRSVSSSTYTVDAALTKQFYKRPLKVAISEAAVAAAADVFGRDVSSSCHVTDFSHPSERKEGELTTAELQLGSSKQSHHLPGYLGHIPMNPRNKERVDKIVANMPTPGEKYDIREVTSLNMCGYTGHKSLSAVNDKGAFRSSTDTTTGRANAQIFGKLFV